MPFFFLVLQIWPHYFQLALRTAFAVFTVVTICLGGVQQGDTTWFIFLTNWTYFVVTLSSVGFLVLSLIHLYQSVAWAGIPPAEVRAARSVWRWYHSIQQISFTVSVTGSLLVTILNWALIGGDVDFYNIVYHGGNVGITLVELVTSNFKINFLHSVYTTVFGVVYVTFSAIYTNKTHTAIYPVLDWYKDPRGSAALAVPASILGPVFLHILMYLVAKLRMKITKHITCLPRHGSASHYQALRETV